jgi:hypothetical protein
MAPEMEACKHPTRRITSLMTGSHDKSFSPGSHVRIRRNSMTQIVQKKPTIAELMREGTTFRPQAKLAIFNSYGEACALGSALEALRGKGTLSLETTTDEAVDELSEATGQDLRNHTNDPIDGEKNYTIYEIITGLNDSNGWSREQIANWLDTVFPSNEEK